MRVFVTGGSGALGSVLIPLMIADGHDVVAPSSVEVDLFHPAAVTRALSGADAAVHLATRVPPGGAPPDSDAWHPNDQLRADATRVLVDAALSGGATVFVMPTVTFVYPPDGPVDETTPLGDIPRSLRSALAGEEQVSRFTDAGRRGVVLRLGLLYGPGTDSPAPDPKPYGAVLHVEDAGSALLAALGAPAGVYNVVADGGRVANDRFKTATGWSPRHG
jgi:nucleoside-diphosphate-sugar epimerase